MKQKRGLILFGIGLLSFAMLAFAMYGCETNGCETDTPAPTNPTTVANATVYIIGDSTVQDYTIRSDYRTKYYPTSGWGEHMATYLKPANLPNVRGIINAASLKFVNKAIGGRSTRTFYEEGRWKEVYDSLNEGDYVFMQFGHNDSADDYPDRFVNLAGYKKYLTMFITQTQSKNCTPVLITPMNRNYPWRNGKLVNCHFNDAGEDYVQGGRDVARSTNCALVDLNQRSLDLFNAKGQNYTTNNYFIPANTFPNHPNGDNTHFQINGAKAMAELIYQGLQDF